MLRARLGERTKAIELLEKALAIYEELGEVRRIAGISAMLASLRGL